MSELQEKYRWIEYHKWKFKSRTFTALTGQNKCPVLMTRVEFGILGCYNKHKRSPFETFYVGGDGMSGYSYNYATETIGLRGYDNGSLTPVATRATPTTASRWSCAIPSCWATPPTSMAWPSSRAVMRGTTSRTSTPST